MPLAIAVWLTTVLAFTSFTQSINNTLTELHLSVNVNYAVDAAVDELVANTADVDTDYADFSKIAVEPAAAVDMFCEIMVRGLGWSDSEENKSTIRTDYNDFKRYAAEIWYIITNSSMNQSGMLMV